MSDDIRERQHRDERIRDALELAVERALEAGWTSVMIREEMDYVLENAEEL